jgi:Protein of unknown function (DUF3302)
MLTLNKFADILALVVLVVVPILVIGLFWMLHVLPVKIAEKRHHPQREGITTLSLLSLAFGGLLSPLAWLWTYTKPAGHRLADGIDKQEHYDEVREGTPLLEDAFQLREELKLLEARGALPPRLRALKEELARLPLAEVAARPPRLGVRDKAA